MAKARLWKCFLFNRPSSRRDVMKDEGVPVAQKEWQGTVQHGSGASNSVLNPLPHPDKAWVARNSSLSGQDWVSMLLCPGASLPEVKGTPWFLTPSRVFSGVCLTSPLQVHLLLTDPQLKRHLLLDMDSSWPLLRSPFPESVWCSQPGMDTGITCEPLAVPCLGTVDLGGRQFPIWPRQ